MAQAQSQGPGKTVRIGGGGGFLGDSMISAPQLLRGGNLDYIVFDYLAEATISILARSKAKNPGYGYARDFIDRIWRENLRELKAGGVKLITNAGGLNPRACAEEMRQIARDAGLDFKIAVVDGDDMIDRLGELAGAEEMFSGAPYPVDAKITSANVYLGAGPIAAALSAGADVVITGRVVDSALVLGPLVHEFGWGWDEYDKLGAGALAGHVLECGAQATGGIFTDWQDVPDIAHLGYPIAECAADGTFVVTKCEGTGGLCLPATVGEQIVYEITDPQNYRLPDVIGDFAQVKLETIGPDRVRVSGAKGRAPSGQYKVCTTYEDGLRVIVVAPFLGRDAAAKSRRQMAAIIQRVEEILLSRNIGPFRAVQVDPIGSEATYGPNARVQDVREVICRVAVEHESREALEVFLKEFESCIYMVGGTGWFGARPAIAPVIRTFSTLIDRGQVPPRVRLEEQEVPVTFGVPAPGPALVQTPAGQPAKAPAGARTVPLIALAWARSGDKGNIFNVGVIARRPEYLPYIRAALTEETVSAYFAHEFDDKTKKVVMRYELPGFDALNFVVHNALGGGQMGSLRTDPLAKGKGQQLLDFPVAVPDELAAVPAASASTAPG